MPGTPDLKREPNGIIYMHWTDPSPVRGKRGRSRRKSTGTGDWDKARAVLGHYLLTGGADERPSARFTDFANRTRTGASVKDAPAHTPEKPSLKYKVRDLWARYDKEHVEKVVSPAAVRSSWKNLSRHFGSRRLTDISQDVVDAYELKRRRGIIGLPSIPATVGRELAVLKACLNWCADPRRRIVSKEDVPAFDVPPSSEPKDRWLRSEEIERLFETARRLSDESGGRISRAERFLWLALETGARKTAISELTWSRVDFENDVIHYNVPGRAKTKKRRASVPISKALRPVLERAYAERAGDLVMDTETNVWEIVNTVARHAGVADVSPHVLRHTAATHMARHGVSLFTIAKILGTTVAMVERVYAKHSLDDLRDAVEKISEGIVRASRRE